MKLKTSVNINASKSEVWQVISNIENADKFISGIEELVVNEKPEQGLVGLKWTETRTLFGKTATETMWITDAVENQYYNTRAESHGAIYTSTISLKDVGDGQTELTMEFNGEPQSFSAKVMSALMGWMFKSATQKALQQDLEDIKKTVESK